MLGIKRREFITLFGGAAAAWPLGAQAQQPAMPVIGYLGGTAPGRYSEPLITAFREGLKEAGFVEGHNVAIEFRWAEGHYERLPPLATELVSRGMAIGKRASTSGVFSMVRNRPNCRYCSRLSSSW